MDIRRSQIIQTSVRKLFPFAVVFSIYLFSYGANFPGGGFQAGVVFGTIVVIFELSLGQRVYANSVYALVEFLGVLIMVSCMIYGYAVSGYLFGGLYL